MEFWRTTRRAWRFRGLAASEIPRRRRRRIAPQPALAGLRGILREFIRFGDPRLQLFRISAIEPGKPAPHYVEYDLPSVGQSPHNPSYLGIVRPARIPNNLDLL